MPASWSSVDEAIQAGIPATAPAAVLCLLHEGRLLYERAFGRLGLAPQDPATTPETSFDLASISKLFTVTLFLQLLDEGGVGLETAVVEVLPEFAGLRPVGDYEHPLTGESVSYGYPPEEIDAAQVSFRHLLTHTSGLAAWLPLYREPDRASAMALISRHPFAYPPGAQCVYSDLGLILLGEAIERLAGQPLPQLLHERLLEPLGAASVHYRPAGEQASAATGDQAQIVPTEVCRWRGRRLQGEVHDENAGRLGGVAGHAGLFGQARDVARLGQLYLDAGRCEGRQLLAPETVRLATRYHAGPLAGPRGLGWLLRPTSLGPELSSSEALAFSERAFGHTGFTGGSIWVDPQRQLVYVLLTNRVYHGRDAGGILRLRRSVSHAVVEALRA